MAIDVQRLLAREFAPVEHTYGTRDTQLYALGVGLGADPLDAGQLRYVYERAEGGLQALPTLVNVLGYGGFWADQPDTGIDWRQLVHAEQAFVLQRPLPAEGRVIGANRVVALHDKGAGKGALMLQERRVTDATSGELLACVTQTSMLRADGGFGAAHGAPLAQPHAMPARAPDAVCDLPTLPQAALLYRLSGDFNPLHADPGVARAAGFSRPILHGLATMGVALHAVLATLLDYDASGVRGMRVRFTAPVLPGETLRTELWRDGSVVSLRTTALERGTLVLNAGRVDLA
ncbi:MULTISPECIES: MaoC/PaaZ C-terminal domain-containing protein [Variovorax]|jgi:acyl dehydratase|uniref:MaoC/PaaZ C-terminal domain-containing protein n=1 Tax=Variovorax TaxID=34072 RepID=UPI000868DC9D|nr:MULTISPECIES: MaoC/PaaZ C-terminal domain-containing protein [Variovorax]MBN8753596.1 MaoC family dehydratase N-terminal domain-containing protein [Variovorax sp.]ODU12922.1 MAG: 3-alpha,7-alpha,12-alpha-trihydroxy-5-beta-cholest-24-enoyl-CoA hydratase [Variovorax sp. SCN 67-85]ODV27454.1 MAG: 3-alpha,7-alpha,12-alpha-trihydroxy-5-beta-cholest-24-enoyl-CoA hydratase [Variovorax sp. SCN 67-20]OJZ12146.1 MAG: 3-alpha,7-alpha,12-alpha-trihydroxy-5-beta-cholest-24-enoyl-CoA hydratase [Variovorax